MSDLTLEDIFDVEKARELFEKEFIEYLQQGDQAYLEINTGAEAEVGIDLYEELYGTVIFCSLKKLTDRAIEDSTLSDHPEDLQIQIARLTYFAKSFREQTKRMDKKVVLLRVRLKEEKKHDHGQ